MNDRSFYLQRLHAEGPLFLRVLRAVPADRLDYAPHAAAPTAGEILNTLAQEHRICCELVATGVAEWRKVPPGTHTESGPLREGVGHAAGQGELPRRHRLAPRRPLPLR